jgi:GNAT superfamily N-acetyltransferase/predicted nucleic acid-binding protein
MIPVDSQRPSVEVRADVLDLGLLGKVIDLGDANRKTLGFLPRAGFAAAADRGNLLVALTEDGAVAAYCLYDLPRDLIRLVHLCVDEQFRGNGLSRLLIDAVSRRHPDRLGIRLKCRPDWDADRMWPGLGFEPRAQVKGRSVAGHLLTIWWKSHGHADLMSLLIDESEGQRVAVDTNVFCDLHSAKTRLGAKDSSALAPLVADDEIRLVIAPSVLTEVYATEDPAEKQRYLSALFNYEVLEVDAAAAVEVRDLLLDRVHADELARDASLRADALLIAEAVVGEVDVVVTRDDNAVAQFAQTAAELFEVTVVSPAEIATVLDIAGAATDYAPVSLQETAFAVARVQPSDWTWQTFGTFLNRADGEKRASLRASMREFALRSTVDCRRELLTDPDGGAQAAWVTSLEGSDLVVKLLRVSAGRLRSTVARQLAFHLRARASEAGANRLVVSDRGLSGDIKEILRTDGFAPGPDGELVAYVIAACGPWEEVAQAAQGAGWAVSAEPVDESSLSAVTVAELERVLWPAKILGQGVTNYFVPIRGIFASPLLGYPPSLAQRDDVLGMSREQVYYRSWRNPPEAPARFLWYSSVYPQEVFAVSRLVESIVASPVGLYRRFARLGVYTQADVFEAAKGGQRVGALRFADTELFANPIPLKRYLEVATVEDRRKVSVGSIHSISDETFGPVYREGMGS